MDDYFEDFKLLELVAKGNVHRLTARSSSISREREASLVEDAYTKYLGRSASAAEVNSWVDVFERGARNEDVIAGFIGSPEYYNDANKGAGDRGTWVNHVFDDVLGRLPTDAELAGWLSQMDSPGYF